LDLRIAATRVLQAQAQLGIARADQFPTVDAGASASRSRVPKSTVPFPLDPYQINDFQLTAGAAWEIDFWGKYRRATEAARASLLASEWGRRAVATSLVSQVASAYFEMRAFEPQLDIATRTLASRRESLRLTELSASGGATSLVDVRQAEQLVYNAGGHHLRFGAPDRATGKTTSASCSAGILRTSRAAPRSNSRRTFPRFRPVCHRRSSSGDRTSGRPNNCSSPPTPTSVSPRRRIFHRSR